LGIILTTRSLKINPAIAKKPDLKLFNYPSIIPFFNFTEFYFDSPIKNKLSERLNEANPGMI
jgi:hypothetical protein